MPAPQSATPAIESARRQFCLIVVDDRDGAPADAGAAATLPVHLVPHELSFLVWPAGQPMRFHAEPPATGPYFAMETIREDQQLRLLAAGRRDAAMMVNAIPAPPMALLALRDQVRLPGEPRLLHVSMWVRPYLGPVPEAVIQAGKTCGLCGEGFESGQRVYICPHCDSPTHAEKEQSKPGEHALRCLEMTPTCPVCQQSVVTQDGLMWMPEVDHG